MLPLSKRDLSLIRSISKIRVVAKKDFPEHPEIPWKVKRGLEMDLPRWFHDLLSEGGFVERNKPVDVKEIEKILHKEQMTNRPLEVPEDIYLWLKNAISEAFIKKEPGLLERRRLMTNLLELSSARLRKMLRYLLLAHSEDKWRLLERLIPEERILYLTLRSLVDGWREDLREE